MRLLHVLMAAAIMALSVCASAHAEPLYNSTTADVMCPPSWLGSKEDPGTFGCGLVISMAPIAGRGFVQIADVQQLLGQPQVQIFCPGDPKADSTKLESGAVVILPRPLDPIRRPDVTNTLIRDAMRRVYAQCPVQNAFGRPAMGFIQIAAPILPGGNLAVIAEVSNFGMGVWWKDVFGPPAIRSVALRWTGSLPQSRPAAPAALPAKEQSQHLITQPLVTWTVSQGYGVPWNVNPSLLHTGLDLAAPKDSRVFSIKTGPIAKTGWLGNYNGVDWGNYLVIQNDDGSINAYLHINLGSGMSPGAKVATGQQIGTVFRDHLHLNACTQIEGCQHGAFPALTFSGRQKSELGKFFLPPIVTADSVPSALRLTAMRAIAKPQTDNPGEDEYIYGVRLWEAKFYPEAQRQLDMMIGNYPRHARISYARYLLGRGYLDDGKPRDAAAWFLKNYRASTSGGRWLQPKPRDRPRGSWP